MKQKKTTRRHSTSSDIHKEKAMTPKAFGFEEMLSELEAIVADARVRQVEEEETA
ncbi:TPA: hypothetical protein ACIPUI_004044 [Citrobacter freundii]